MNSQNRDEDIGDPPERFEEGVVPCPALLPSFRRSSRPALRRTLGAVCARPKETRLEPHDYLSPELMVYHDVDCEEERTGVLGGAMFRHSPFKSGALNMRHFRQRLAYTNVGVSDTWEMIVKIRTIEKCHMMAGSLGYHHTARTFAMRRYEHGLGQNISAWRLCCQCVAALNFRQIIRNSRQPMAFDRAFR
ncbi:hypothetical protein P3T31_004663 [Rhizobium sp. AN70]|nr:hypothetical protein [Rhizobium sp. AN70]